MTLAPNAGKDEFHGTASFIGGKMTKNKQHKNGVTLSSASAGGVYLKLGGIFHRVTRMSLWDL